MSLVWVTGFSGAGKTTVSKILLNKLKNHNLESILLDGDEIREALGLSGSYSSKERKNIAYSYAKLAKLVSDQGIYVIVATISMFDEVRSWNRENNKHYIEVYLKVSQEERKLRNHKNLYVIDQEIAEISDVYEEPKTPNLIFDSTDNMLAEDIANKIFNKILETCVPGVA